MNKTVLFALLTALLLNTTVVYSATLIESRETHQRIQRTWVDGTKLRVDSDGVDQYMLMDFTKKTMHIVKPERMQAVDLSDVIAEHNQITSKVDTSLYTVTHNGQGPTIAGYTTEHYIVFYDEQKCFESFTSLEAVQELHLEYFISGMNEMFPRQNSMDTGGNPCHNAENALDYKQLGLPLKLIKQGGEEIYTITKLEGFATVPYGGFSIPKDFRVINYNDMVMQMKHPGQK